tara:strand:- start:1764 stop:2927 length:1164 start_codon:yes stop_codon:yes gene_type:complete
MENNRNLFKEAIADAKAVKEVSIANAKAALEEVITPRLKSMFEQKLTEMEEEDDKQEEGYKMKEDSTLEEEFNLEELLAELDEVEGEEANEEEVTETVNESEEVTEEETHEEKVYEEEETEEEEAEEADEDKADDSEVDIDFDNMTEDDLRAFIEEVVDEMIDAEELALSDEAEEAEEEMEDEDVEIDIEDEMEDIELEDEVEDLEEVSNQMGASAAGGAAELEKMAKVLFKKVKDGAISLNDFMEKLAVGTSAGMAKGMRESDSEELAEATDTIKILQTELNEVNLLNSKLLYVNKILKGSTLKESQKVKVITAFDKAETVKEVKLVYETLKESISKAPTKVATKKLVRESKNFASSTINGASPNTKPVMEVDPMIARMKKLAGLT